MTDQTTTVKNVNIDKDTPTYKKLDDLYALIDGIELCMFTTRRSGNSFYLVLFLRFILLPSSLTFNS